MKFRSIEEKLELIDAVDSVRANVLALLKDEGKLSKQYKEILEIHSEIVKLINIINSY